MGCASRGLRIVCGISRGIDTFDGVAILWLGTSERSPQSKGLSVDAYGRRQSESFTMKSAKKVEPKVVPSGLTLKLNIAKVAAERKIAPSCKPSGGCMQT